MRSPEIRQLKQKVLKILEDFPKARNSDQWLTIKLWCVYFPTRIHIDSKTNDKKFIFLNDIMELPREDDCKRIRAIIQNVEHKFLPTEWKIAKKRKIKEEIWKEYVHRDSL